MNNSHSTPGAQQAENNMAPDSRSVNRGSCQLGNSDETDGFIVFIYSNGFDNIHLGFYY